jgi:vitamin B12 transporter
MKFMMLVLLVAQLLLAGYMPAEEKADKKNEKDEALQYHVVVTATRTEEAKVEVGSTVSVILAEDLKKSGKKTVADALATIPGLDVVRNGGPGTNAGVHIRGANTEHTLIMIDGVELNDPSNPGRSYDFAHLGIDNIERIEIVHGPQSTLYGSDAIGGVINIITRAGVGKPRFYLSGEGGSYSSFSESAGFNGGTEKMSYSLGVSRFDSKGFSAGAEKYGNTERDAYGNTTLNAKLEVKPSEKISFDLMARHYDIKSDMDNNAGEYGDDPNSIYDAKQSIFAANIKTSLMKGKWNQRLGFSFNNIKREYDNPTDALHPFDSSNGIYKGRILKTDWQHNFYLHPTNTVTAGIEYEKEFGESEYNWKSAWGPGQSLLPKTSAGNAGIYLQDNLKLGDILFTTFGVRFDDHSRFGNKSTFRIATALVLESETKIKGSYGTGFKAPTLYQLYAPATYWGPIGNENLNPEESIGWDVGIEQFMFKNRLNFGITYFSNEFDNLIQYDWAVGFINVASAATGGLEMFLAAFPVKNLNFRLNYTYTKSEDKTTGEELLRRPKHKANASVNYKFLKKADAYLDIIHVGKRFDVLPFPIVVEAAPYTLFNLTLTYEISGNIEIFGRIINLFDVEYEEALGYGTAGLSGYLGIRLNY